MLLERDLEDLTTAAMRKLLLDLQSALTILLMSASPRDQKHLLLSDERREIEQALRATRFRDAFHIHDMPSCRVRDISQTLFEHNPSILHFSGHGSPGGLCFQNDAGGTQVVRQQDLAHLFQVHTSLKLVIMNACYSASQAQAIADQLGYVIAMDNAILDRDAVVFAREFYIALGYGKSIESSFASARAGTQLDATSTLKPRLLKRRSPEELSQPIPEQEKKNDSMIKRLLNDGAAYQLKFNLFGLICLLLAAYIMFGRDGKSNA